MDAVMRAEAGLGPDHGCTGNAALQEEAEDLAVQEIILNAGVLIQVNRDFSRRTGSERLHESDRSVYEVIVPL